MNNICKRKINKTTAILLVLSMIFVRGTEVRASDSGADIQPEKTIAAQWKANAVKITFNSNGGGVAPNEQVYTYGTDRSLPGVCSMNKTGYSFIGWSESASATVPDWKPGDTSDTRAISALSQTYISFDELFCYSKYHATQFAAWYLLYDNGRIRHLLCDPALLWYKLQLLFLILSYPSKSFSIS